MDRHAGRGHAGRVGKREIVLIGQRLCWRDRNFAGRRECVVVEGQFFEILIHVGPAQDVPRTGQRKGLRKLTADAWESPCARSLFLFCSAAFPRAKPSNRKAFEGISRADGGIIPCRLLRLTTAFCPAIRKSVRPSTRKVSCIVTGEAPDKVKRQYVIRT